MKTIFILIGILTTSFWLLVNAQTINIIGKVTNMANEPIPGVNVVIKGTTKGTLTDLHGKFKIGLDSAGCILVFSYVGYEQQEILVNPEMINVNVTLTGEIMDLEEVVVIGYGVSKKSDMTGYVVSISKALSGRASGMKIRGERSTGKSSDMVTGNNLKSGTLTAGEVNDFSKWELWKDISDSELKQYRQVWHINPVNRYSVQLKTTTGLPVIGAKVTMIGASGHKYWSAVTDNTGKSELWYNPFMKTYSDSVFSAVIEYNDSVFISENLKKFHDGINIVEIPDKFKIPKNVDIAFVVDATSSMSDEIQYLKTELLDIMLKAKDTLKKYDLNLGTVFYRDNGDEYVTKKSNLSSNLNESVNFINNNTANGGGDFPEAVHEALKVAINDLSWSKNALAKIMFLVLDAPPHQESQIISDIAEYIEKAAEKGIRVVPVTCSGIDKSAEYLMRSMALLTNGTYSFLTDDSGVGNSHIKPSTDEYEVELLNELILRLICQYTNVPDLDIKVEPYKKDILTVSKKLKPENNNDTNTVKENTKNRKIFNKEPETQIGWKYYPNPTDGLINIESEFEMGMVYVSDMSGKILQRRDIREERNFSLDISSYSSGIYFICYEYETDKWLKGKVILVH